MAVANSPAGTPWKILVVDDVQQVLKMVELYLTDAGYSVALAESGEQAIVSFQEWRPDLVLLDVMMPGLDGFQTCHALRALPGGRDVSVVFLTGFGDPASIAEALESEADDFLIKPIARAEIILRVRSLLRERQLRLELSRGMDVIRAQRDALVQAQRQKDELSALVVHDLKSPLAAVLANVEFVLRHGVLAPDHVDALRDAQESAHSIDRLALNLLDIGRSENGTLVPRIDNVDVRDVVTKLCESMKRRAEIAQVELTHDLQALMGRADSELLTRMVENLLDNGLRHSRSGGRVHISTRPAGDRSLEIRVSDQGPGVPQAWRERIFEKYAQMDDPGGSIRAGRGLGLAFCRLAAEAHGGRIWVEPNEPRGSVFCVSLPAADAHEFDTPALAADSEG